MSFQFIGMFSLGGGFAAQTKHSYTPYYCPHIIYSLPNHLKS